MREGISVLAELVDRIEAGEVRVEDASLRRAEGAGLDVDLSVHIPDDAGTDTLARGATERQGPSPTPDATTDGTDVSSGASGPVTPADPPAFGARSVSIGASLGGDHAHVGNGTTTDPADDETGADAPDDAADEGTSDDEPVECRVDGCEERFATEHGMKIHATKAHREADGSGPSPHRDPERLREVYEAHDTFDEMTAALDVDVTAQTVRRSMMSLGIHDPDGTHAAGGAPAETSTDDENPAEEEERLDDEEPSASGESGEGPTSPTEADGAPAASGDDDDVGAGAAAQPDSVADGGTDTAEPGAGAAGPAAEQQDSPAAEQQDSPVETADGEEATDPLADDDAERPSDPSPDVSDTDETGAEPTPADDGDAGAADVDEVDSGSTEPVESGSTESDDAPREGPPVEAVLPPDVDADVLVTAVQDASTLFQVQRAMGVEREEAQTLLAELDLLDLVTGRVATEDERDASREEIERRIVEAATEGSAGDGTDEGGDERADPPVGAE